MVDCGSSGRSWRRRTAGCISRLGSGGGRGEGSRPFPGRQERLLLGGGRGSRGGDLGRLCKARVRLLGRRYEVDAFEEARGQMHSATDAVGGSISLLTTWQQPPGAPSTRRTTSRPTTDALSRDVRWVKATRAHTGRPSARIAGGPMGRGQMPVLPRGRPACPPRDGGHHPLHAGREGPWSQRCPNKRPQSPRGRERWARWGPRGRSNPVRRAWRNRRPGGEISLFCLLLFLFPFSCVFGGHGEKGNREPR